MGRLEVPGGCLEVPAGCLEVPAGRKNPPNSEKKLLRTPAGRKDPPGGEQGDGHREVQAEPPWTEVRKGKSVGSRIRRPG